MPLRTKTIDFDSETHRLTEKMDELAEQQANTTNARQAEQLLERGTQLDRFSTVLEKLAAGEVETVEQFDEVELAGLSPGEVNLVADIVDEHERVRERDAWVAVGTHNAPFVEHDPEEMTEEGIRKTIFRLVDDVPLPFVRWAEERISDLSHLGMDEGNGYLQRVKEKRQQTQADESG